MRAKKKFLVPDFITNFSRFTKKVMVSAGVSWNGKTDIHFIDTNKTKVNSESYTKLPDDGIVPDCILWGPLPYYIVTQHRRTLNKLSHTS